MESMGRKSTVLLKKICSSFQNLSLGKLKGLNDAFCKGPACILTNSSRECLLPAGTTRISYFRCNESKLIFETTVVVHHSYVIQSDFPEHLNRLQHSRVGSIVCASESVMAAGDLDFQASAINCSNLNFET